MATDERGQVLRGVRLAEEPLRPGPLAGPCPLTLVVVTHRGTVLLGMNRWRGQWELPGGLIESGETARAAAVRELEEESGLRVPAGDLRWEGFADFGLVSPVRSELAAMYTVDLVAAGALQPSHELVEPAWCDPDAPPALTSPLDLALARWTAGSRPHARKR